VSVIVWNNVDDDMKKPRNLYVATKDTKGSLFYLLIVLTLFQQGDGQFFFSAVGIVRSRTKAMEFSF
jgi:hypothetical protein